MVSNRGPSVYQPNTLLLGQTGSQFCVLISKCPFKRFQVFGSRGSEHQKLSREYRKWGGLGGGEGLKLKTVTEVR